MPLLTSAILLCSWMLAFSAPNTSGASQQKDKVGPGAGLWLGSYHVVLDSTNFGDLIQTFHAGEVHDTVISGIPTSVLCYVTTGPHPVFVEFESGDIGGPSKDVVGYVVEAIDAAVSGCPEIPMNARDIHTDGGVRLGMGPREFMTALRGGQVWQIRDEIILLVSKTVTRRGIDQPLSVIGGVRGRFKHERLSSIYSWKIITT